MNINNILMVSHTWWDWHKVKNLNIVVKLHCSKKWFCDILCFTISILDSVFQKDHIISYVSWHITYARAFWDKVIGFTDEPVVQCDAPAVKNTSLDYGDNDNSK